MPESGWHIEGYTEAVIGVADPAPWCELLEGLGGWQRLQTSPNHLLLGRPDTVTGAIRLEIAPHATRCNRQRAASRDSGGLFDVDFRVADLHAMVPHIEALGWQGLSSPIDWRFGELDVREWLATGPDGVVLAFMERLRPALNPPQGPGLSHAFNASQIVRNMETAVEWYTQLGFRELVRHSGPLPGRGGEVLGLSPRSAPETPVDLVILSATGVVEGSVELVSFPEHPGQDLAEACDLANLGLRRMRFPVLGLEALTQAARQNGWSRDTRPDHALYLYSPDNACLEFYAP